MIGWICLSIACQSKVIIINNEGSTSNNCCQFGGCPCSSFFDALTFAENNTFINIASQMIVLNESVPMRNVNNITFLGNNTVVDCKARANVTCAFCNSVVMEGITWHQCGFLSAGVGFYNATDISLINCKFQFSDACAAVWFFNVSGYIRVHKSQFLSNYVTNSYCSFQGALAVVSQENGVIMGDLNVTITDTVFECNGILDAPKTGGLPYSSLNIFIMQLNRIDILIYNTTISSSIGVGVQLIVLNAVQLYLKVHNSSVSANDGLGIFVSLNGISNLNFLELWKVTCSNNTFGGSEITVANNTRALNLINITSSIFSYNINGCLKLVLKTSQETHVLLENTTITGNTGAFSNDPSIISSSVGQGTGILFYCSCIGGSYATIKSCNISGNSGNRSIVYLVDDKGSEVNLFYVTQVSIISSNFTNNFGSALSFSRSNVTFEGHILLSDNSAQSGAAIYFSENSQAMIAEESTIELANNYASQYGGAVYINLPRGCVQKGVTFKSLPDSSVVSFTNNSAEISGNSLYLNIPMSCEIERNSTDSTSLVHTPYRFKFTQLPRSTGSPIVTSPYAINLCSTGCEGRLANNCSLRNNNMLGEPVVFSATICGYYNNVSEAVQFYIACTDCNNNFRPSDSKILIYNGSSQFVMIAADANIDFPSRRNITINLTSVSVPQKIIFAVLYVEMSTCHSGFVFDAGSHQCECYDRNKIIQCERINAEIKYGYWFGIVSGTKRSVSLCPTDYCDFSDRSETGNGYYSLPRELNDQCNTRRTGMACGECSVGYTLAYDSTECIDIDRCSSGMIALAVILTVLYWFVIVAAVFGLMFLKLDLSLGYLYGIIFYYSVVDILLGTNLYISYGVFQFTTILTSFAKLTPQFLGKLCFAQGFSGIDQQFMHYVHPLAVSLLIVGIVIAARCSVKISLIISRCIIRVICLLLLLSYTSIVSTSLQLLRPLYYQDVDDLYVYLSPSINYFTGRHVVYSIVACLSELLIAIAFPLLLLLQPFLKSKINFIKIKPLLDQFQGCYKDHLHCFASYYLICRQVLIAIAFNSDFDNALYYLQAVSVIIVTIHVWVQPYRSNTLNVLDGIILLTIVLVINLQSYSFVSSTIITLVVILVMIPLCVSSIFFFYFYIQKRLQARK